MTTLELIDQAREALGTARYWRTIAQESMDKVPCDFANLWSGIVIDRIQDVEESIANSCIIRPATIAPL